MPNIPVDLVIKYGLQAIGAIVILAAGLLLARWMGNITQKWLERQDMEPPIRTLLVRLVKVLVLAAMLLVALDTFGVKITPLIAGLGVAGLGVGLAFQGVLSNVVAGLTIIFTKPYRIGEYIEIAGAYGQVETIDIFSTKLVHADRSRVVIPNRKIVGEILHNYGTMRQLNLSVGVGYGTNLTEALTIVRNVLDKNPRVLKDPAPFVGISQLGDSAIAISILPWTKVPDYGLAQAELYQTLVEGLRARNIDIPFPQREVRVVNAPPTGQA
jgi:small conductance mechanosensitive channel